MILFGSEMKKYVTNICDIRNVTIALGAIPFKRKVKNLKFKAQSFSNLKFKVQSSKFAENPNAYLCGAEMFRGSTLQALFQDVGYSLNRI